ncbi:adenylate/guanylate cyclase domain-containing protein [Peptostreptococcaceae bacterium AGR-M142]
MRKHIKIISFLIIIFIISSLFTYSRSFLIRDFFGEKEIELNNISHVIKKKDYTYILYKSADQKIFKTKENDIVEQTMYLGVLNEKGELFFNHKIDYKDEFPVAFDVDEKGVVYILSNDLNDGEIYIENEVVSKIDPFKMSSSIVYKKTINGNLSKREGNFKNINIINNNIVLYEVMGDKVNLITIDDKMDNNVITIDLDKDYYINYILGEKPGNLFFYTKKSELYLIDASGDVKLVYKNNDTKNYEVIENMVEDDDYIYFQTKDSNLVSKIKYFKKDDITDIKNKFYWSTKEETNYDKKIQFVDKDFYFSGKKPNIIIENGLISQENGNYVQTLFKIDENANYKVEESIQKLIKNNKFYRMRIYIVLVGMISLISLIGVIMYIYVYIMQKWLSIAFRQILIFIPIIFLCLLLYLYPTFEGFIESKRPDFENAMFKYFTDRYNYMKNNLDIDLIKSVKYPSDYNNSYYSHMEKQILSLELEIKKKMDKNEKYKNYDYYNVVYRFDNINSNGNEDIKIYKIFDDEEDNFIMSIPRSKSFFENNFNEDNIIYVISNDKKWILCMGPLFDENENIVGAYQTGMSYNAFIKQSLLKATYDFRNKIYIISFLLIFIIGITSYRILYSLKILNRDVKAFSNENTDQVFTQIDRKDEIWDLNNSFRKMAKNIMEHIRKITKLSEAYLRFVPQKYLYLLDKESIEDVDLGDYSRVDMNIFNASIHNFYDCTKNMTDLEAFNFINDYLKIIGPIVKENEGILDSYEAKGLIALFQNQELKALDSAFKIIEKTKDFNEKRRLNEQRPLDMSIGIHSGNILMGIIGEKDRLQQTIISQDEIDTRQIQMFTFKVNSKIIVTKKFLDEVKNDLDFNYRYLGIFKLRNNEDVEIYDIFDEDEKELKEYKLKTRKIFEEGISLYHKKEFYEARKRFIQILKLNPMDFACRIYFYLSDFYMNNKNYSYTKYINNPLIERIEEGFFEKRELE